jgi:hypothetical protein
MLQQKLDESPEMEEGLICAIDFLPMLRTWWAAKHLGAIWPGCDLRTAQRIGRRLAPAWWRAHAKRRPTLDEERRTAFLAEIPELLRTMPRGDVANADETAFLLHMTGIYRWARRGAEGVQIPRDGKEKLSYTVMVAVTAAPMKLPIRVIVEGKTAHAEKG